jgi:phage terminase Nu1 subunit (DNA packaging protein)
MKASDWAKQLASSASWCRQDAARVEDGDEVDGRDIGALVQQLEKACWPLVPTSPQMARWFP